MIRNYLKTPVEIYGNGAKVLNTIASVHEEIVFLDNVDVKELDIVKVIPTKKKFRIAAMHKQLDTSESYVIYIKAKVDPSFKVRRLQIKNKNSRKQSKAKICYIQSDN